MFLPLLSAGIGLLPQQLPASARPLLCRSEALGEPWVGKTKALIMVRFEKAFGGSDLEVHFITGVNRISKRGKWAGGAAGLLSGSSAGEVTAHAPHCNLKSPDLPQGLVSHTHHMLGTGQAGLGTRQVLFQLHQEGTRYIGF